MASNIQDIDLRTLIGHNEWVDARQTLEEVRQRLSKHPFEYMAVLDGDALIGLCSRADVGMRLGHRYGFALFAKQTIREHLLSAFLEVRVGMPLTEVLSAAFNRTEEHFYDDIALLDEHRRFLGLIFMRTLVMLQNRYFLDNIEILKQQRTELNRKNQQMERNLLLARKLQRSILPDRYPTFPPNVPENQSMLRFHHLYRSAELLGGDFFHVAQLGQHRAGILLCDVMGHGVSSALITSMMRAMAENLSPQFEDPGALIAQMNREFFKIMRSNEDSIFATATYLSVDIGEHGFRFASAGHPLPLRLNGRSGLCETLGIPEEHVGTPLGILEHEEYRSYRGTLRIGDRFLLYTDGLFEVHDLRNEPLGSARLIEIIAEHADLPADEMLDTVFEEVKSLARDGNFEDDVCVVSVEVADLGRTSGESSD